MGQYIMANGKEMIDKDMEYSYGVMVLSMMGIGSIIMHMVKANFITRMVIFMKENGPEIKPMVMENTAIEME